MNGLGSYWENSIYNEGIEADGGLMLPGTALDGVGLIPSNRGLPPLSGIPLPESGGNLPEEIEEIALDTALEDFAASEDTSSSLDPITGIEIEPDSAEDEPSEESQELDPLTGEEADPDLEEDLEEDFATESELSSEREDDLEEAEEAAEASIPLQGELLESSFTPPGGLSPKSGYIEVGSSGEITVNYLFDGGAHRRMRVGLFSLEGMGIYPPLSRAFKREAARRINSNSLLGVEVIKDRTHKGLFSGSLPWERDFNRGQYIGLQTFQVMPESKYGIMVLPTGNWRQVIRNPRKAAWISLDFDGQPDRLNSQQIADVTGDGTLIGIEDILIKRRRSDRDYNDIVFQVTGGNFVGNSLDELINPNRDWRSEEIGLEIIDYALGQIGEEEPPVIEGALAFDSGYDPSDGLTFDPKITGTVTDQSEIAVFRAGFEPGNKISALTWLAEDGSYQLTLEALETIKGEALSDGDYTLYLEAEDAFGNIASHEIAFTLDSTAPILDLSSPTSGAELTPGAILAGTVNEAVELSYSFNDLAENQIAASEGNFETVLDLSSLEPGSSYTLTIIATDLAGNETSFEIEVSILAEDNDAPEIAAALALDTGASSSDGLTSEATITGTVTDSGSVLSLRAGFGDTPEEDYLEIIDALDSSGNFTLDRAALEEILANRLTDGSYELHLIATDDRDNTSEPFTVSFSYDSTAPELNLLTPLADGNHSNTARLIGSAADEGAITSASYSLDGGEFSSIPIAGDGSFDLALANPLSLGDHQVTVEIQDAAGNETASIIDFAVTNDFAVGATGSPGWGAANSQTIILSDRDSFFSRAAIPVELGNVEGSRTLTFQLETSSTSADIFQVFLVSASDPEQTLLDGGQPGTAVFSLTGETAEFIPGLVRYDGSNVEIDLSSLGAESSGQLLFKAINNAPDSASLFQVKSLSNIADPEGFVGPTFPVQLQPLSPGSAIDTSGFSPSSSLEIILGQVRLDEATGNYTANLQVQNNGEAIGRNVAISFPDLPAGVSLQNASGTDGEGNPYINLRDSIDPSGLDVGETSAPVEVVFANPDLVEFSLIGEVLVGGANIAPQFEAVGSLSVMPGSKLEVPLVATDPDGETVTFQIQSSEPLPTGKLSGNGTLVFTPTPEEIGTYTFNLIATDGAATTTQEVTLTVEPDTVTTTRVSGTIENTDKEPLAGVVVELGGLQAVTAADGTFTIEVAGSLPDDTLKVRGENIPGSITYPFIAEKLPLVLERDAYEGYNNVISRPIYLPPIDTANAQTIDPNADVTVTTAAIPGAAVEVAAGSLLDQQGNSYTGELSITAVPNDLTPAALPPNLSPDLVVTIQPGEMVFTTPAPLSLPNLVGYQPGQEMDLWSINPVTGQFDKVGTGRVSADGSIIETISGGIRNSSWHLFTPEPGEEPADDPRNPDDRCEECKAREDFTSSVEMHSGAVLETHNLVPYQSKGASRSLSLTYDSLRADPRAIVHFGYDDVAPISFWLLMADLTVSRGGFSYQVPGIESGKHRLLPEGRNFWDIPSERGAVNGALQVDMRSMPSGQYDYSLNSGIFAFDGRRIGGTGIDSNGKILHVNSIESAWGAGWGLAGLQELIENPDGSVLLVDGDGSELLFEAPSDGGNVYVSPPGDFSTLERQADGTFSRTLKDETVYRFNDSNKLSAMLESNGNETQYLYNGAGQLEKVIDPASLETSFSYTNGKVTAITDPAFRTTILSYDSAGNLTRIIDPDSSARTFGYDSQHHITSEIDKRGNSEQTFYDFAGRASRAIRKDGTELMVAPVQVQGLYRPEETYYPLNAPVAFGVGAARSSSADASGNVVESTLDAAGQTVSSFDSSGFLPSVKRDEENLVTERASGRGRVTSYERDVKGNVISIADEISGEGETPNPEEPQSIFAPGPELPVGSNPADVTKGDVNGDGNPDIVTTNRADDTISVLLSAGDGSLFPPVTVATGEAPKGVALGDLDSDGDLDLVASLEGDNQVSVLPGNGDGTFGEAVNYTVGFQPTSVALGDLDNDGDLDMAVANNNEDSVSILLGNGDGSMGAETRISNTSPVYGADLVDQKVTLADLDADSDEELILSGYGYGADDRILIYPGNGDGSFGEGVSYQAGAEVTEVVAADLNSDGNLDLVTANQGDNNASVLLGNGDGTFQQSVDYAAGLTPSGVGASDVDGDGDEDIVLSGNGFGTEDFVEVFLNNGDGNLSSSETVTVGSNPGAVELADLNNDGSPDLVVANRDDDTISIRLNAGNSASTGKGPKRFTYDPKFNKVTSFTDEEGRQTLYEIDQVTGNVLSVTRVVGEVGGGDDVVTSYTYTDENLVDVETDPLGRETDYDYDSQGNLIQIVFAKGTAQEAVQQFEYDAAGNQTAFIDENGNRTEYEYDGLNRLVKVTFAAGTADEASQQFEYDGAGNRTAFVDENGNRTSYEYDEMNRLVKTIEPDPDGAGPLEAPVVRTEYDLNGNQSAVVDALGRRTEYRYDSRDRLIETIYPDGSREEARYDFDNNLISTTDANGNRTNNTYDARGRLVRRVDAQGKIQILEYNAANELVASTDENGYRQEFSHDDLGRQTAVTDSEGTTTTEYDKAGNVTAQIDPLGNRTELSYDALNRQTVVKDALTGETVTKYDGVGNVIEVTDPEQNTTTFTYDARNRLKSETNELGDSRSFDYDSVGSLIRTIDRNNRITEWTYDALNRPQQENWLDSGGNPVNTISFAYDAVGQLVAIDDSYSSYRFTYDEKGRQTSVDNTGTPGAPNVLLQYAYDNLDNLLSVSETINGKAAGITAYTYDELNRTSQITQTGAGVSDKRVDFGYDAIGQFASIERYSDLTASQLVGSSTYTYDALNRLENLSHANGSGTFAFYDFEYDAASRITKIVDIDGTSSYSYDKTNQLTGAIHTDLGKPNESYTYDDNGNRTNPGYQTGQNNQLQSDGIYNYQYDAEGNMVLKIEIATGEEREFVWDHRNRLTAIVDKDIPGDALQEVGFTYDAMNRRIAKEVNADPQNSTSGVAVRFIYDRNNVLLEFVDADGIDGQEEPTFHQRYLHGPAVDQMLAQENASGESVWNFTDQLGTGRDLTDNSGNVVNHLIYDSFGNVVSQTDDTIKSRYLFTGREFDEETGLYNYRARYYDGWLGRFLNPDPIGFSAGDPNLYRYVANSPIQYVDPYGLRTEIYVHTGGAWHGHAAINVNGTVYTYGRYGLDNPTYSRGTKGDGILYAVPEDYYLSYASSFRSLEDTIQRWSLNLSTEQESEIVRFFEDQIKEKKPYEADRGLRGGERVRDYSVVFSNCVTITIESLPEDSWIKNAILSLPNPYAPWALADVLDILGDTSGKVTRLADSPAWPHWNPPNPPSENRPPENTYYYLQF